MRAQREEGVLWYFIQNVSFCREALYKERIDNNVPGVSVSGDWAQLCYHHLLITRAHITNKDWASKNKQRTHWGCDN